MYIQTGSLGDDHKIACCLNCNSSNPRLALARVLEEVYAYMASQKLAEPFLHPLLPMTRTASSPDCDEENDGMHEENEKRVELVRSPLLPSPLLNHSPSASTPFISDLPSSPQFTPPPSPSEEGVPDLFAVQEKIRMLSYSSYAEFLHDLAVVRDKTIRILNREISPTHIANEPTQHCIVQSFDSMAYNAFHPSHDKKVRLAAIEDRIRGRGSGQGQSRGSSVALLEERMLELWRRECIWSLGQYFSGSASAIGRKSKTGSGGNLSVDVVVVSPRTFMGWCEYLKSAKMVPGPQNEEPYVEASREVSNLW